MVWSINSHRFLGCIIEGKNPAENRPACCTQCGSKNPLSIPGFFSGVLNSSEIAREGSGSRQFRTVVLKYFKQRLNFLIPKGFGKRRTNGVNPAAKALFKKHVGIIERKGRILGEVFP